ncbi:G-protein coupled receptor Mth2-like isoform X2 [Apis laboriosa]|uniref:G-protein coupled receptor Mth2-like isoform X2 n=1 Tax=Apis laboriosa TaxID=183418 RepID=UPI001CC5B856|nr:G-protein coupled receptor Mth2-like isoform X2 [Apis laboriosa]
MTTRNFMIVLSLLIDASYAFNKCCSPGEVFTGTSKVNCAPTPLNCSIELFLANGSNSGFPICEKPEYIATTPLDQLNSMSFVQNTSCIEILHEPSTSQNVPILVHCNSNEKEQLFSSQSLSKLRFLNVRRCCSSNEVFNVMPGNCESSKNVEDDLLTFFNVTAKDEFQNIKIISINKELLECPKSNAMFTYEIDAEDVTILDESLKVKVYSWENQTVESFTITEKNSCLAVTPDFRSKRRIVVRVCRDEELCRDGNCVNKCFKKTKSMCQEILISNLTFYDKISNITGTPRNVTEYGVIRFELNCSNGMYMERIEDTFGISSNGSLKLLPDREWLTQDSYCVDMLFNNKQDNYCKEDLYALICFPESTENRKILKTILEGISFIFLLLTLIVYICLPVLQNLHGKTLMSHVASLMIGYLCISLLPWLRDIKQNNIIFCCASGFLLLFSFLSAFSWLNIMCFDIWRTFGRLQGNFTRDQNHGKTFLLYCLYAWGLPMFITVFGILDDQILILPNNFRPHFNEYCWFKGHGQIIYFRGVVAIQLLTNMVFFFLTTKQCNKVKAELKKVTIDPSDPRNKQFLANKSKFIINMKLFIVMGISWIGEIVSALIENYAPFKYQNQLFYLTDTFNCLQGLWIFILFVVKRRVHQALKKRLGFDEKKKFSRVTASLQDPFKMRKSVSNSTLTSTFAVSSIP